MNNKNRRVFFISDTHFGHSNILKYCGRTLFMSPQEIKLFENNIDFKVSRESTKRMDDSLINSINNTVGENDILYHLGDFCFSSSKYNYGTTVQYYRNKINCKNLYLIFGNHDAKVFSKDRENIQKYFTNTFDLLNTTINNQKISLCHYALAIWDCRHHKSWCLYGHSHSRAETWMDEIMNSRYSIDVGVDNAYKLFGEYRPFSFNEIENIFSTRTGFGLLN